MVTDYGHFGQTIQVLYEYQIIYLIARFSLPLAEPSLNAGIFLYFKQPFNKT